MDRMALTSLFILAAATAAAVAQDEPVDQAPKPTLTDVQRLAEAIGGDSSKLDAYCRLGRLHDETQQAVEDNNLKAADSWLPRPTRSNKNLVLSTTR